MGALVDLANVADVLELLDEADRTEESEYVLLDANVLLYSVDSSSPHHTRSADWIRTRLRWPASHRAALANDRSIPPDRHPSARLLATTELGRRLVDRRAVACRADVLDPAGRRAHSRLLGGLISGLDLRGNLVTDAQLAALAIEHGLPVVSVDSDFARFDGVQWINPLAG